MMTMISSIDPVKKNIYIIKYTFFIISGAIYDSKKCIYFNQILPFEIFALSNILI